MNVSVVSWSPTGGTQRCAMELANACTKDWEQIEFTSGYTFHQDDVVIFAFPVYAGRLPKYVAKQLEAFIGNQTKAIAMVVYGNRAYEDALLELNDLLLAQRFEVIAGIAAIAQHSIVHEIASNRPDANDIKYLQDYAQLILDKLVKQERSILQISGNYPYVEKQPIPVFPVSNEHCIACGTCLKACPTQAILETYETDAKKCISCMHCVAKCSFHARVIPSDKYTIMLEKLTPCIQRHLKYEIFI